MPLIGDFENDFLFVFLTQVPQMETLPFRDRVLRAIERYRVTIAHWVPTMIKMFTEAPDVARHVPALEGAVSFGADNDALKPIYIIEARDGKWTLLETHPAPN